MMQIWIRTKQGNDLLAFHWTRTAQTGVQRAIAESKDFGHEIVRAYAIEDDVIIHMVELEG